MQPSLPLHPSHRSCRVVRFVGALILGLNFAAAHTFAATQYFTGAGGPKPWDTAAANWAATSGGSYNSAWVSGNVPTLEGTGGTVNVGSGASSPSCASPITFSVNGYTLTGGQINFSGSSVNIIASTAGSNTVSSVLSGNSSVKFQGSGGSTYNLLINGPNTFTGTATIQASQVFFNTLANGGVPSSLGQGVDSSTPVVLVGNSSFTRAVYVGSGGSTDRPWQVNGTGAGNIFNNGTGAISFNNTGNACGGTAGARTLILQGTYTAATNTFAETLNDTGTGTAITSLSVIGNIWNITGNNTHSGGTSLGTGGGLSIGHANALGAGTFTVSGNGSFDNATGGDIAVANAFTLSGGSPTYVGSANSMSINGAVTLSGANRTITVSAGTLALGGAIGEDVGGRSLTSAGSGTLALHGVNAYSGGTIISGTGILLITNDTGLGSSIAGLTFSGSGILAATNNGAAANNPVTLGSSRTITVNSTKTANFYTPDTNDLVLAAKITGLGGVKRFAAGSSYALGSVRFSNNNNDYTGEFTAAQGRTEFTSVANVGTASSLGKGTTGTITIANNNSTGYLTYVGSANSSTTRPLNWTSVGSYSLENNGSGTIAWLASSSLRSTDTRAANLTLAGANTGTNTLAQVINDNTGTTALTKGGVGRWVLTGVNTYSGNTTINAGTLALSSSGSIANSPSIIVAGGATFDVSGLSSPPFALGASQTLANTGAGTANLLGNISTGPGNNSLTYSSGTPAFTTAGTLTLAAGTTLMINNPGAQLGHGSHKLIAKTASGSVTGSLPTSYAVTNGGTAAPNYLWLSGGELYLAVNNAPAARNVTVSVPQAGVVVIPFDLGKYKLATDTDSDPLTITSVSATLGNVVTDGSSISYTNTSGIVGSSATINFTVADNYGGTNSGTVSVLLTSATGANLVSATVSGDHFAYLTYAGIPGTNYALDHATSISPESVWSQVTNKTAAPDGMLRFTNQLSSWPTNDYFRTRYVP